MRSRPHPVWLPDPVPSCPSVVSAPPEPSGVPEASTPLSPGWTSATLPSPITVTWLPDALTGADTSASVWLPDPSPAEP